MQLKGRGWDYCKRCKLSFDELDLCAAENMIRKCESDIGCKYTDSAYLSLVLQLAIMVWETKHGRQISLDGHVIGSCADL